MGAVDSAAVEARLALGTYRWRSALLSLAAVLVFRCGQSGGVPALEWLGFFLLCACYGACTWLSVKICELKAGV